MSNSALSLLCAHIYEILPHHGKKFFTKKIRIGFGPLGVITLHCPKDIVDFPRYNMKCSGKKRDTRNSSCSMRFSSTFHVLSRNLGLFGYRLLMFYALTCQ